MQYGPIRNEMKHTTQGTEGTEHIHKSRQDDDVWLWPDVMYRKHAMTPFIGALAR